MRKQRPIRRIRDLIDRRYMIYLWLPTESSRKAFQFQCKNEDIRFEDGVEVTERKPMTIMRLLNDGTICFVGFCGGMAFHSPQRNIRRIDFERYIAGERKYLIKRPPSNGSRPRL